MRFWKVLPSQLLQFYSGHQGRGKKSFKRTSFCYKEYYNKLNSQISMKCIGFSEDHKEKRRKTFKFICRRLRDGKLDRERKLLESENLE
jgi:hypothetical protein